MAFLARISQPVSVSPRTSRQGFFFFPLLETRKLSFQRNCEPGEGCRLEPRSLIALSAAQFAPTRKEQMSPIVTLWKFVFVHRLKACICPNYFRFWVLLCSMSVLGSWMVQHFLCQKVEDEERRGKGRRSAERNEKLFNILQGNWLSLSLSLRQNSQLWKMR